MRIIKNGACKLQDIQQFKCLICGCVYELDLCDEEIGKCPCCHAHKGYQVRFNDGIEEDVKTKTPDEVYPEGFCSFKNSLHKSDEEIKELIRKTIELYKQSNCGYAISESGRVLIAVFQLDSNNIDDYQVVVTKDYSSLDSMSMELLEE